MILSNVNIGTGPSSGDGSPLRSAFSIINNNFQLITNNVNALTNSVNSVAGRTGNVILTINDIVGINVYATNSAVVTANVGMRGYVDATVSANIAALVDLAPSTLDTLRELADAIGDDPNFAVNVALSVSSANTKMRGYVDGQITAANAGVTSANLGMKGYVDNINSALTANAATQSDLIIGINANVTQANLGMLGYVNQANTIQAAAIVAANVGMKGYVDNINSTLTANAATQSDLIIGINANVVQANLGMKGYVDSVASQSLYGNSNVKSYLTGGFDGDIIPSANVTYSLGNVTHQWKDLWVSNTTIYIGGTPISTSGGNLLVNGNAILTDTELVTYGGNIAVNSLTSGANAAWAFGTDGSLTFPDTTVQTTAWTGAIAYGNTIAIGYLTGTSSQGNNAVAIGSAAGQTSQGAKAIGIGEVAGRLNQGIESIGLGAGAGEQNQGAYAIAIGSTTAYLNQGVGAVAIGTNAGALYQGEHAIAIGTGAGAGLQGNNSIILNATGTTLDQTTDDTFTVKPIRSASAGNVLYYDPSSGEITYNAASSSYGNAEVATYLPTYTGNIAAGNVTSTTLHITDFTPATNPGLSAVQIAGAATIGGNVFIQSSLNITGNIDVYGQAQLGNIKLRYGTLIEDLSNGEVSINGNITAGNISALVNGYEIGYRTVPQVSAGNVTLALTDSGKHYYAAATAPTTLTIPSNANVAFPVGTAITIINKGTGDVTVSNQVEVSLYLAGNSTSSSRTLSSYGMATIMKTATNEWFINGTGLV